MINKNSKRNFNILASFCFLIFAFSIFSKVDAATLYFSPSSGNFKTGDLLTTSIMVNTQNEAINNADATVSFPPSLLEVASITKSGSIFSLWVEEPTFSNSEGAISFNGGLPTPGYNGTAGKIINVVFRVKNIGSATIVFSSGAVRANDGYGTDILQAQAQAQFSLSAPAPAPVAPTAPATPKPASTAPFALSNTPSAPEISSQTHPDQTKWYSRKDAKFAWSISSDINRARLLVGKIPVATPTIVYSPAISEKEITGFEDGVWYFHAQLRNASGWGDSAHFKLQIDTQPPEPFDVKFVDGDKTENPRPTVSFETTDSLSSVDYYKVKIGENEAFSVSPEIMENGSYSLPLQKHGKRSILVQAFDKAGNYATALGEFEILPIKTPILTEYPKELKDGEWLIVRGSTYSDGQVIIWIQEEGGEPKSFTVQSDADGKFNFIAEEKLKEGIYSLWAVAVNNQGAQSMATEKITIKSLSPAIFRVGIWATSLLSLVIPLIALVVLLQVIIWYGWYKFSKFRKRLKKEVREVEAALHKTFDLLKEDIRKQVKMLEKTKTKRQLTEEEEKIIKRFGKHLDKMENIVKKEIKDIEKEIK